MATPTRIKPISLRFTEEEGELIKEIAKAKGTSRNALVKDHVFAHINKNFNTTAWQENYNLEKQKAKREAFEAEEGKQGQGNIVGLVPSMIGL